jgi:hypothetical protein
MCIEALGAFFCFYHGNKKGETDIISTYGVTDYVYDAAASVKTVVCTGAGQFLI